MVKIISLVLLLFLAACSPQENVHTENGNNRESSILILSEKDNHRKIVVKNGDTFRIRLKENRTTGYEWVVDKFDEDSMSIKEVEHILSGEPGIGEGGHRIYEFKATKPMTSSIRLVKRRSWESEDNGAETFTVKVAVTE